MAALEAGKPHEIEDVLASIRRLVAQSNAPLGAVSTGPKAVEPAVVPEPPAPVEAATEAFLLTPARRIMPETAEDASLPASIAADPDPEEAELAGPVDFVDDLAHELARLENTISQLAASVIADTVAHAAPEAETLEVSDAASFVSVLPDVVEDEAVEIGEDDQAALQVVKDEAGDDLAEVMGDDAQDDMAVAADASDPEENAPLSATADDVADDAADDLSEYAEDTVVTTLGTVSRFAIHRGATDPDLRPSIEPDADDDLDDALDDDALHDGAVQEDDVHVAIAPDVLTQPEPAPMMATPTASLPAEPFAEPRASAVIDEDTLRPLVARLIREELRGVLGERITQNVRKLVRREMQRSMLGHDPD